MPGQSSDLIAFLNRWPRRLAALCCLLLAGASVLAARAGPSAPRLVIAQPVAVAARAIPAGGRLSGADITIRQWPRSLIPAGTAPDARSLLGKRAAAAIGPGEAITALRLVGADLAARLPAGYLAVPVSLADANAAALIRPGDTVDVLAGPDEGASLQPSDSAATGSPTSGVVGPAAVEVAAGVRVLAVLPGSTDAATSASTELIIAMDRAAALRVATLSARPLLAVRDAHP